MLSLFTLGRRRDASHQPPPEDLRFRVAPDVKASLHAQGLVLIHLGKGTVFSANRIGAMIWKGAAEQWSLDRVAASISREYHIPRQTVHEDAARFLAQLAAEGLLVSDAG